MKIQLSLAICSAIALLINHTLIHQRRLLKEPIRLDLLTPDKAQQLMSAVESGQIPITEAIKLLEDIIESSSVMTKT